MLFHTVGMAYLTHVRLATFAIINFIWYTATVACNVGTLSFG